MYNVTIDEGPSVLLQDEVTAVLFHEPIRTPHKVDFLTVTLRSTDLSVSRQVYAGWSDGFVDLGSYFCGLADAWRGWSGERVFESVEGDLRLVATHTVTSASKSYSVRRTS